MRFFTFWLCAPVAFLLVSGMMTGANAQDLDAGKTGAQLFAQDCSGCHRSPQGLIKTAHAFSLNSFLRQHYTTSSRSAAELAAYLNSVGSSAARGERQKAPPATGRAGGTPRESVGAPSAVPAGEAGEKDRATRSPRKQAERPTSAPRPDRQPEPAGAPDRQSRRDSTAARDLDSPKPVAAPPSGGSAAVKDAQSAAITAQTDATMTATVETRLPPPVEAAEPSGIEAGTPVTGAPQRVFSSPVP